MGVSVIHFYLRLAISLQLHSLLVHGSIPAVDWLDPLTARAIELVKQVGERKVCERDKK